MLTKNYLVTKKDSTKKMQDARSKKAERVKMLTKLRKLVDGRKTYRRIS